MKHLFLSWCKRWDYSEPWVFYTIWEIVSSGIPNSEKCINLPEDVRLHSFMQPCDPTYYGYTWGLCRRKGSLKKKFFQVNFFYQLSFPRQDSCPMKTRDLYFLIPLLWAPHIYTPVINTVVSSGINVTASSLLESICSAHSFSLVVLLCPL